MGKCSLRCGGPKLELPDSWTTAGVLHRGVGNGELRSPQASTEGGTVGGPQTEDNDEPGQGTPASFISEGSSGYLEVQRGLLQET